MQSIARQGASTNNKWEALEAGSRCTDAQNVERGLYMTQGHSLSIPIIIGISKQGSYR